MRECVVDGACSTTIGFISGETDSSQSKANFTSTRGRSLDGTMGGLARRTGMVGYGILMGGVAGFTLGASVGVGAVLLLVGGGGASLGTIVRVIGVCSFTATALGIIHGAILGASQKAR